MNIIVDRKVIEQALEALEQWNTPLYKRGHIITALRTALEQTDEKRIRFDTHLIDMWKENNMT